VGAVITRQEGFRRLAREYVAMQGAPRQPGVFSELYVRGFEAAVETALDRQEEGRTISWVRLAYDRVMDDVLWEDTEDQLRPHVRETIVTLLVFEWGLHGRGHWEPFDFDDDGPNPLPEWLISARLGDIIGHTEPRMENHPGSSSIWPASMTVLANTSYWRLWPSGWEKWITEV
jgi:hypothetical protein